MAPDGGAAAWRPGALTMYRWLPNDAGYPPDDPWPGAARFDDGVTKTLYVAASAESAMAEFFRSNPEFVGLAEFVDVDVFALGLEVAGDCLDVRTGPLAERAGITLERLRSSDREPTVRYAECLLLARRAIESGNVGIAYPSAAAAWDTFNLVLMGDPGIDRWVCRSRGIVARPAVDAGVIRFLDGPAV